MTSLPVGSRLLLKNLLFLSDFSDASELAIPFVANLARKFEARVHALHALTNEGEFGIRNATTAEEEEQAQQGLQVLSAKLADTEHDTAVAHGETVWNCVREAIRENEVDLVVMGTHGRSGSQKIVMGSVAEEIFRKTSAPVLTIGPSVRIGAHNGGNFKSILYATDFSAHAEAALPYALSVAEENEGRLYLLHVLKKPSTRKGLVAPSETVADAMHHLHSLVPKAAEWWCKPEAIVRFGEAGDAILSAARELRAELIVMGVRDPGSRMGEAIRSEAAIAHRVVANAVCPVLTKRG